MLIFSADTLVLPSEYGIDPELFTILSNNAVDENGLKMEKYHHYFDVSSFMFQIHLDFTILLFLYIFVISIIVQR